MRRPRTAPTTPSIDFQFAALVPAARTGDADDYGTGYSVSDWAVCLAVLHVSPRTVAAVLAAWGRSPEGDASWEGGFVYRSMDGTEYCLRGWCGASGWSGPRGVFLRVLAAPFASVLEAQTVPEQVDLAPADLNIALARAQACTVDA